MALPSDVVPLTMRVNMKTETRFGITNDGINMETKPQFEAIKDWSLYGDRDWIILLA